MAKNFGSTAMLTARDKRRQARKSYRKTQRARKLQDLQEAGAAPNQPQHRTESSTSPTPHRLTAVEKLANLNRKREKAAARRVASLESSTAKGSTSSKCRKLSLCDFGSMLEIASFLPVTELHQMLRVSRRWRYTLLAHDSFLWRPHCLALWSGRYISQPELRPFVDTLAELLQRKASHGAGNHHGGHGKTSSHSSVAPLSWREALCRSLRCSTAETLTPQELTAGHWQIRFLLDESIPAQELTFHDDPVNQVRTEGFPAMPWALYDGGKILHIHVFPEQSVQRDHMSWKWEMKNGFVHIEMAPDALAARSIAHQTIEEFYPPPLIAATVESDDQHSNADENGESQSDGCASDSDETQTPTATFDAEAAQKEDAAELAVEEMEALCTEGYLRLLKKPRTIVGRERPLPIVCGHGGDCDGEDPPPQRGASNLVRPCTQMQAATSSALEGGSSCNCDAGLVSGSIMDSGVCSQQGGSRLSQLACLLLDIMLDEEYAKCQRTKFLRDGSVAGCVRFMDSAVPRRVRLNFPAHLLDQGRPCKPP